MYARSGSLRAHATQVDPNESWWFGLDDAELAAAYPFEDWVLAKSAVGAPDADVVEIDLFAGIKDVIACEPGQSLPSRLTSPALVESAVEEMA
jgi:mycothiol S-conjugate amidase